MENIFMFFNIKIIYLYGGKVRIRGRNELVFVSVGGGVLMCKLDLFYREIYFMKMFFLNLVFCYLGMVFSLNICWLLGENKK